MKTTCQYLDEITSILNCRHDADVARALGVTRQCISKYRNFTCALDDPVAIRAAEILGIHPGIVLLDMHVERSKDQTVKTAWFSIASVFQARLRSTPTL